MQKKYSKEFKREAVRLMVVDGLSGVEVSKKLGVNDSVIYRWKKEHLNEMEFGIGFSALQFWLC